MKYVKEKLKKDTGDSVKFVKVGVDKDGKDIEGIPMMCYKTECVFEILVYRYRGTIIQSKDPPLHRPTTSPGRFPLIIGRLPYYFYCMV